jgi:hypothetical protein
VRAQSVRSTARSATLAGCAAIDHRWVVLAATAVAIAGALAIAGRARIDNSYEAFFAPEIQLTATT